MQQQEQTRVFDVRAMGSYMKGPESDGARMSASSQPSATMPTNSVAPAQAKSLTSFHFSMRESRAGEPIAMGAMFALSGLQARQEARKLTEQSCRMLRHMMPHVPAASFTGCLIRIESRALPLADPPMFALREEDWLTYAGEIIVRGPAFFGPPSSPHTTVVPMRARTALCESRADDHIQRILSTDPAVRRAWLEGRNVSWLMVAGYMPAAHPMARAAIHVTADDEPLALQICTIAAVLCIQLRANNYARRNGIMYHRNGALDPLPNSAAVRAALAQAHRQPGERRVRETALAVSCLRRSGLDDLALQVEAQAMAALPER